MKTPRIGWKTWKGETSRWLDANGYVCVRIRGKTVLEHRLVAEEKMGRALRPGEIVHHVNAVKADNRPENIRVVHRQLHNRLHCNNGALRPLGAPNEKIVCACGCGASLWQWDSKNRERRYISGHNQRGRRWRGTSNLQGEHGNETISHIVD